MPDRSVDELVAAIHAGPRRFVIAVTGGGSRAIADLLSVPGASRSILEAAVPYSAEALTRWLGVQPEQFCHERTARAMAMAAYLRATHYESAAANLVGIACTASLASNRPKRGPHRAYFAVQTRECTLTAEFELNKGARTRREEEVVVAGVLLNLMAQEAGLPNRLPIDWLPGEQLKGSTSAAPGPWQELLSGKRLLVAHEKEDRSTADSGDRPGLIFPGAFNPLHAAHRRMARLASEITGRPLAFELSIHNVDKPPLDFQEIKRRSAQFGPEERLYLTHAATFVSKAALFPGATFVVGADTIRRIADDRYYTGGPAAAAEAINRIAALGCRFLVFGRAMAGEFRTLSQVQLPPGLAALCNEVPAAKFREDVSSTELRRVR